MSVIYNIFTRKPGGEWKLSFVVKHHVLKYKKEQFAKSRGLEVKTETKRIEKFV